jgi:predicted patatin/cPLA2 family phospholipase
MGGISVAAAMLGMRVRPGVAAGLLLVLLATLIGCAGRNNLDDESTVGRIRRIVEKRSEEELKTASGWLDLEAQSAGRSVIRNEELLAIANRTRLALKPASLPPKKTILVLSGGGVFGAYPAGVLCGWTEAGTRPEFDVVTGVSTGALIGVFAFLGSSVDSELRRFYTTTSDEDVYRKLRFPRSLLSESLADNSPLAQLIEQYATDEVIRQVAVEHNKGRRLYVATTDLDVRRAVVWDMGAIASRDTPADRVLFRKVLLASAAIPGFFPPVRIAVVVDGTRHVERHIDGGITSSMFFAPPWVSPEQRENLPSTWLYDSNVYILVAGKMYPDPVAVKSRTFSIASNAVSTILYDQTRSDLHKLFLLSILTGMNYNLSVIPKDLPAPIESTSFKPEEMTVLFEAGEEWARKGGKWRTTPSGYEPGEGARYRAGVVLTDSGRQTSLGGSDGNTSIPPVPPKK